MNFSSSFEKCPSGPNGASSESRWLRPFSRTMTDQPASASTCAAVAPPGPLPTITASQSTPSTGPCTVTARSPPNGADTSSSV